MQVILYSDFKKKKNSTKLPNVASDNYECILKDNSSAYNATIILEFSSCQTNIIHYSYAYIPSFYKYYYVDDIKWSNNRQWEISLVCDALATYRSEIINSRNFCLRSSATRSPSINDDMYPFSCQTKTERFAWQNPFQTIKNGTYMICGRQTGGVDADMVGSVSYVGFKSGGIKGMVDTISNQFTNLLNKPIENLTTNPLDFIEGSYFLPFTIDELGGSIQSNYTLQGFQSHQNYYSFEGKYTKTFSKWIEISDLPNHPQSELYGQYLNSSNGTTVIMYIPSFGVIPLNSDLLINKKGIYADLSLDLTNGNVRLNIFAKTSETTKDVLLESINSNCSCNFSVTSHHLDLSGLVGGIGNTALSGMQIALGGNLAEGVSGVAEGMAQTTKSCLTPQYSTIGSTSGGLNNLYGVPFIQYTYQLKEGLDTTNIGYKVCDDIIPINTGIGFYQFGTSNIEISGSLQERADVQTAMLGGFFYE